MAGEYIYIFDYEFALNTQAHAKERIHKRFIYAGIIYRTKVIVKVLIK
jgi:hypothetical protein